MRKLWADWFWRATILCFAGLAALVLSALTGRTYLDLLSKALFAAAIFWLGAFHGKEETS